MTLYRPDIAQELAAVAAPPYRYTQVYEHLLRRPLQPFSLATALPATMREALAPLGVTVLQPLASRSSSDGTTKFLLSGLDGALVEAVLMRYRDRVTACISSQVGCPVRCTFCATGAMGLQRNLSVAEIVDQVRVASALASDEGRRISNVVYMGMGEPLLNLQALLESIGVVTDPHGLGLGHRSVAVSTIGIPRGILRLARSHPQVNLALSLHAADDRTRALLIPEGFRHPLSAILKAAWEHFAMTRRKLLIEYVLLHRLNDSPDTARRLAGLLRGHVVTVNLLPWNPLQGFGDRRHRAAAPAHPKRTRSVPLRSSSFRPSSPNAVAAFRDVLLDEGVEAVIRRSKGSGIAAACGQLAGRLASYDDPA